MEGWERRLEAGPLVLSRSGRSFTGLNGSGERRFLIAELRWSTLQNSPRHRSAPVYSERVPGWAIVHVAEDGRTAR